MKKIIIYLILVLVGTINLYAQEAYYWNINYGTKSILLGGSVIGSVSDLSATYYNPGAVALFKEAKFILTARVYQLDTYTIKDGASEGVDLDFSTVRPSPSFIAFEIDFDFLGNDKLALSLLTRQSANFEFSSRLIDSVDIIDSSPGKESFAGGFSTSKDFNDVWGGITYATKFSEIIGFGFTGYISYLSHRTSLETILQAFQSSGDIASLTDISNYDFNNVRALGKFGIGFDFRPLTLGLTVTTPSLNITGSGSAGTHFFLSGADTSNIFESNFQEDATSEYKSPMSVGVGGAYSVGDFKFHLSIEWYDAIDQYTVLDTQPYESQSSGESLTNDLTHEAQSVTNFGIGIDYFSSEKLILSAAFTTDFSARVPDTNTNLASASTWDLYHVSAGSTFIIGKSKFTLGVAVAVGSDTIENSIDLTPSQEDGVNNTRTNEVNFNSIQVLFGFEI
ncbi:MAG: hypothetical protein O6940_14555 [Ignavibacteria bacterium]|nr:hypothetical protein [Ignavibacteria bacterium]